MALTLENKKHVVMKEKKSIVSKAGANDLFENSISELRQLDGEEGSKKWRDMFRSAKENAVFDGYYQVEVLLRVAQDNKGLNVEYEFCEVAALIFLEEWSVVMKMLAAIKANHAENKNIVRRANGQNGFAFFQMNNFGSALYW